MSIFFSVIAMRLLRPSASQLQKEKVVANSAQQS